MLKRKYGPTLDEVIAYGEELKQRLNEIENRDDLLAALRKELAAAESAYLAEARALHRSRAAAAAKLQRSVESHIADLAMKARFEVEIAADESNSGWRPHGIDSVQYLIATNAGEPLKPLDQIASGGELSRVMLALKASIFAASASHNGVASNGTSKNGNRSSASHPLRTLVFDEIDTGIGGRAADAVGQKLKQLARSHQVLCITHLPQIAACADHHFVIEKSERRSSSGTRTTTSVRPLAGRDRTEEIARMLSGAVLTPASIKNAEQMLKANA
jgi:DNA repair protein RecN (Recombination protein N)